MRDASEDTHLSCLQRYVDDLETTMGECSRGVVAVIAGDGEVLVLPTPVADAQGVRNVYVAAHARVAL